MRQRRVIGLSMLGVVVLLMSLVVAACTSCAGATVSLADQTSDATTLELAQRYIARDGVENTDLLPGQLPGDLPFSFSLPPNSRIVGSVVRHLSTRVISWEVILDAPTAPPDVTAFYN